MKMDSKGFAMVELLTAMAIIGTALLMLSSIYFAYMRLLSNQNGLTDIANQNKVILDEIVATIRQSAGVVDACCNGETTSANSIVLQLWPLDNNGDPFPPGTTNYDFMIYKLDATDTTHLLKNTVTAPVSSRTANTRLVATSVSGLQFAYLDNNDAATSPTLATQVTITATTATTSYSKNLSITRNAKAVLRNK